VPYVANESEVLLTWNTVLKNFSIITCKTPHRQSQPLMGNPPQIHGASPATWDHTVLPATQHRWTRPTLILARQAGTRFIYSGWTEGRPHRGQPPCRGGGALHQWTEKFLKSGGEELTKRWPKREGRLLHVTSAFVLVSVPQPTTASQPSFYGFTAVYLWLHSRVRLYSRYL